MIYSLFAVIVIVVGLAYIILILIYLKNWKALDAIILPEKFIANTRISVIIPIRNEGHNIKALLRSILANRYPTSLIEIIVVDDHSTDDSIQIIQSMAEEKIKVLSLADFALPDRFNSFKKFGIEQAVLQAKGDLILTTDGDCIVPNDWLNYFAYCYEEKQNNFIAAPVNFQFTHTNLSAFQCLDFMGMMLITGANIKRRTSMMCNGANLGYSRKLFLDLEGYQDIDRHASGDDVMLLNKISASTQGHIGFIKNAQATVETQGVQDWSEFVQQRLRWATKNGSSNDFVLKLELGIVYLLACSIILTACLIFLNWSFFMSLFIFLLFSKFIGDYMLLSHASTFFGKTELMKYFSSSFWMHTLYIAGIGTLSLFKKQYTWKGRQVK